jgi:hypothetical protein
MESANFTRLRYVARNRPLDERIFMRDIIRYNNCHGMMVHSPTNRGRYVLYKDVAPYIKEARPTVRAKRPVQQPQAAICATYGIYHYRNCPYYIGNKTCSNIRGCLHKRAAVR